MDLKEISSAIDPNKHWYYRTKKIPLLQYFNGLIRRERELNIIDIGAGSGYFSNCLIQQQPAAIKDVILVDPGYSQERYLQNAGITGRIQQTKRPPERIENALILMMDVLEHAADDKELIRSIILRCHGTNYFFITVPAFQSLWSPHDEFLGHYRRYNLPAIKRLASGAGISITSGYYLYAVIFPLVFFIRRFKRFRPEQGAASDLKPHHWLVSLFLETFCRVEFFFRRYNGFFGLTCVIEGRLDRNARQISPPQPLKESRTN